MTKTGCRGCTAIGEVLRRDADQGLSSVTACSALKRSYRDILRTYVPSAFFVELDGPVDLDPLADHESAP